MQEEAFAVCFNEIITLHCNSFDAISYKKAGCSLRSLAEIG